MALGERTQGMTREEYAEYMRQLTAAEGDDPVGRGLPQPGDGTILDEKAQADVLAPAVGDPLGGSRDTDPDTENYSHWDQAEAPEHDDAGNEPDDQVSDAGADEPVTFQNLGSAVGDQTADGDTGDQADNAESASDPGGAACQGQARTPTPAPDVLYADGCSSRRDFRPVPHGCSFA
jgi:hypothetical protein